jgi:GNAT superfamily N-acetyltransferase
MEALNMLHLVTARTEAGQLVGYHVSFVTPHPHYKNVGAMAFTDMYWTNPLYRVAGLGAKLIAFLETSLRARGVVKAYLSHKVAHDRSRLFEALGWKASDRVYCKYLGGK